MLKGKTAVVTGGSRGIGRAIVERLCRNGADVAFNFATSKEAAADVVRSVRSEGGKARAFHADLTEANGAERFMEAAEEHLGSLDILVNNAALALTPTRLADTEEALFDSAMKVNAKSTFMTMRYAARSMRDGGRIVNISTINTTRSAPGLAAYAASKGAIEQLTAVAARELGSRRITVNTISPGATDTELLHGSNSPESLKAIVAMTPLGRLGRPTDIARVVGFLVSSDGDWVTGQNIQVTGGIA